jgi:cytochrome bd-type quinol oxidase subunit 2
MSDSTRGFVRLLVALFYAGGAVLLLLLLAKGNADALAVRIGLTALSAVVLGLVAAAGARLFEHREPVALWGAATIMIAIVTFVAIMAEAWPEHFPHHETRVAVMVAISILLGGGSLTLSDERPDERQEIRVARSLALGALVALGVFTVLTTSDVHVGPRWFGIAATVFVISALSPPLRRLVVDNGSAAR